MGFFSHLQIFRDFHEIEVDVFIASCTGEEGLQSHEPWLGMGSPLADSLKGPSMVLPSPGFSQGTGTAGCPMDPI